MEELKVVPNQIFIIKETRSLAIKPEKSLILDLSSIFIKPDDLVTGFAYKVPLTILPEELPVLGRGFKLSSAPEKVTFIKDNPNILLNSFETIPNKYNLALFPSDITWVTFINLNLQNKKLTKFKSVKKIPNKPKSISNDTDYLKVDDSLAKESPSDTDYLKVEGSLAKESPSDTDYLKVDDSPKYGNGFSKAMGQVSDALDKAKEALTNGTVGGRILGHLSPELQNTLIDGLGSLSQDFQDISKFSDPSKVSMRGLVNAMASDPENGTGLSSESEGFNPITTTEVWAKVPESSVVDLNVDFAGTPPGMPDLGLVPNEPVKEPEKDPHYRAGSVFGSNLGQDKKTFGNTSQNWYSFFEPGKWSGSEVVPEIPSTVGLSKSFKLFTFPDFEVNLEPVLEKVEPSKANIGKLFIMPPLNVSLTSILKSLKETPEILKDKKPNNLYTLLKELDNPEKGNFQYKVKKLENGKSVLVPDFYSNLHNIILDQQVQQQFYVAWFSYFQLDSKGQLEEIALDLGSDFIKNYFLLINNFQFSPAKRGSMDFNYHYYKTSLTSSKPEGNNEFSFKLPMDIGLRTWEGFLKQGLRVGLRNSDPRIVPANFGNFFTDKSGTSRKINLHIVMPSFRLYDSLDLKESPVYFNHLFLQDIKLSSGSDLAFSQSGNNVDEFSIKGIYKRLYLIQDQKIETKKSSGGTNTNTTEAANTASETSETAAAPTNTAS